MAHVIVVVAFVSGMFCATVTTRGETMHFDRFDVCEAAFCFACLYHTGQFSDTYRIFGRLNAIGFRGCSQGDPDRLLENARAWFDRMVEDAGFSPYEREG